MASSPLEKTKATTVMTGSSRKETRKRKKKAKQRAKAELSKKAKAKAKASEPTEEENRMHALSWSKRTSVEIRGSPDANGRGALWSFFLVFGSRGVMSL